MSTIILQLKIKYFIKKSYLKTIKKEIKWK